MSWILLFLLLFDFSIVNFISLTFSEFNLYKEEEFICVVDKISQLSFSILKSQHLLIALGFEIIFSFWHTIKSLLSLKALLTILFISFFLSPSFLLFLRQYLFHKILCIQQLLFLYLLN